VWPVDTFIVTGCGKWVESPKFGRRCGGFDRHCAVVVASNIYLIGGPCAFRMAGKSVYEDDAFWSVD
jgi:hypothetical protein